MLFSKTIKLLICLVIIMPYIVQAPQASAAVNYDHNALSQYKGYGEVMYETIVDQTTFVTGQYTNNKQYVKDSMGQIKDYANFWLNEQGTIHDACSGMQIFTKNCLGELTSSAGGYALTVGDFIKNLFTGYETQESNGNELDYSPYEEYLTVTSHPTQLKAKSGYRIQAMGITAETITYTFGGHTDWNYGYYRYEVNGKYVTANYIKTASIAEYENISRKNQANIELKTVSGHMANLALAGVTPVIIKTDNTSVNLSPVDRSNPAVKNITNYIKDGNVPQMILPQPKAYLSCPDGTKIDMAINGATFLDATGKVMNVSTDGTAQVSSQICNLGWEKPKVEYVDDKPAITDPDGNWLDIITGEMLECVLLDKCEITKPDDKENVKPLDNTLIEYVKNAYEYATNVLKTGTDGLKSLAIGAKELTALFGVFFGWLPKEMVVLMSSGLAIAVGLRLFRK